MTREELLELLARFPDEAWVPLPVGRVRAFLTEETATEPPADLSVTEVAERWHRGPSTVRGMCEAGELAGAYKFNRREWRIPRESVLAYEAAQRRGEVRRGPGDRHGLRTIVGAGARRSA